MSHEFWALLYGLAWSAGGFIIGYFLGKTSREIHEVKEALVTTTTTDSLAEPRRNKDPLSWVQSRPFGVFLIVLAVLTVAVSGYTLQKQGEIIDCQTAYNEAYSAALQERTRASKTDRDATREMVRSVVAAAQLPQEERGRASFGALNAFLVASAEADKTREANPLPTTRCP